MENDVVARIEALFAEGDLPAISALFMALNKERALLVNRCDAAEEDARIKGIQVNHLFRLLYGRRSEKLSKEDLRQLCLELGGTKSQSEEDEPKTPHPDEPLLENPDEDEGSASKPRKRRPNHKGRQKLPLQLERIIKPIEIPAAEKACKCCGEPMQPIGTLDHETVEHVPEKFVVHVERREKLACKACEGEVKTAPRTEEPEIRVGTSVLATLLDGKGQDALPIYRQADRFSRLGWEVPYSTLLRYWAYAADLLAPVADATVGKVLDDDVVAMDDTGIDVLGHRKGDKKFRGHLWCFTNTGPLTGFRFTETWAHQEILPWIFSITGFIQVDDYKGYSAKVTRLDGSEGELVPRHLRLGCMMHVRRKFYEAFALKDKRAAKPISLIKEIYKIEEFAKAHKLCSEDRYRLRQEKSRPLLEQLYEHIQEQEQSIGFKSKYARAVRYAISQKEFIERCFSDGRFEIDNGKTEREIRRPAVGRKNFLFTGSPEGGHRLATVYTLILSCRNLGIDTREYLIDVMDKIRDQWPLSRLSELIPDNWAKARGLLV